MLGRFIPEAVKRSAAGDILRKFGKPLMPGWVDEGRKLVQQPELAAMIDASGLRALAPRRVLNAGAGQGLYSHLLLRASPVGSVVEIDLSYASHRRDLDDPRQVIAAASL